MNDMVCRIKSYPLVQLPTACMLWCSQDDGGALAEDAFDRRFDGNSSFYVGPFGRTDIDGPFRESSNFDASLVRQRDDSISDGRPGDDMAPPRNASRDESDSSR